MALARHQRVHLRRLAVALYIRGCAIRHAAVPPALLIPHHGALRGYTSYTYETLDPEKQTEPDNKEGLYFGREVPEDSEEARTRPLHGPNQWPDAVRAGLCPGPVCGQMC